MTASLPKLLLRLLEGGGSGLLWGRAAKPYHGRAFEKLLERRVLVELPLADTWGPCSGCDCSLEERPIQRVQGALRAACPLDHAKDTLFEENDLRSFLIDAPTLVREIASASGLPEPVEIMEALWSLGPGPNRQALFLALTRFGATQPGLVRVLKAEARGAAVTLLIPGNLSPPERRSLEDAGLTLFVAREALAEGESATPFRIETSLLRQAPSGEILLEVLRSERAIRLHGIHVPLSENFAKFVEILARAAIEGQSLVPNKVLMTALQAGSTPNPRVVPDTLNRFVTKIKESGVPSDLAEGLILNQRSVGYRLSLSSEQIVVR